MQISAPQSPRVRNEIFNAFAGIAILFLACEINPTFQSFGVFETVIVLGAPIGIFFGRYAQIRRYADFVNLENDRIYVKRRAKETLIQVDEVVSWRLYPAFLWFYPTTVVLKTTNASVFGTQIRFEASANLKALLEGTEDGRRLLKLVDG